MIRCALVCVCSLRNEVDGIWETLEEYEDREDDSETITHSECLMLQRVLSDKSRLPRVCIGNFDSGLVTTSSGEAASVKPAARLPELARRLTGAVPGAFTPDPAPPRKKELGGHVSLSECRALKQFLEPSAGGFYLMPTACNTMLQRANGGERGNTEDKHKEQGGAKKKKNLARRISQAAEQDYPPTFV
eukprot:TRINITY_DN3885_c0_g1_i2.p1 TRINITY_DN3885_c0_g1~~TRINITY_DN3885_c0_g1_i2.p1  ORF type:complete len:189 (-),score=54.03 TRINITY_DN3885_c0_g1_i2:840-1406(-)